MKMKKVWAVVIAGSLAAVLGAACGDDGGGSGGGAGTGVCADVSCNAVPTFSGGEIPWELCTSCHSNDATTRAQNGVPEDSDYTTYAGVSSRIQLIAERVHASGVDMMPPSGSTPLTDADRKAFTTWGCCDGPE